MIALFASLAGFLSSIFPQLFKYYIDKSDKGHELEIMKLQIKLKEKGIHDRLEEIEIIRDINESKSLYQSYTTGIYWVDALNGTVRPVLAYSFFGLYAFTKMVQFWSFYGASTLFQYLDILWSVNDQAIFAGIISFYYGNRTISKLILPKQ
jgi:hypothetical protein